MVENREGRSVAMCTARNDDQSSDRREWLNARLKRPRQYVAIERGRFLRRVEGKHPPPDGCALLQDLGWLFVWLVKD